MDNLQDMKNKNGGIAMRRMKKRKMVKRMRRVICAALATAMLLALSGCGNAEESKNKSVVKEERHSRNLTDGVQAETVEGKESDAKFAESSANFSIGLLKKSAAEDIKGGSNVLISPESVLSALAMTANGSDGDTLSEMEEVICSGMGIDELNRYMRTYNDRLNASEHVSFSTANSIWIRDDGERIKVNDEFLQTDKNYYDADAFMAQFDDNTVNEINSWVSDNTNGMIDKLVDQIPDEAVMYLINAVAFEGEWDKTYKDNQITEGESFTNYAGVEETVTMLSSSENEFISDDSAKGFIKYYKGGEYAFMAVLPNEGVDINKYISEMTGEKFLNLYNSRTYAKVNVKIPEFSYEYAVEMKEPLVAMGIESAFDESADFSRMAETESGSLYINRVFHKSFIQLDRYGTKAAAVTEAAMVDTCAVIEEPEQVYLDRPFIYSIIDTDTGIPVFIGVLNTVTE